MTSDQAFGQLAKQYEKETITNPIVRFTRKQVYRHVFTLKKPPASILEINAGSGIDALALAKMGYTILATDSSDGMLDRIKEKNIQILYSKNLTFMSCRKLRKSLIFSFPTLED